MTARRPPAQPPETTSPEAKPPPGRAILIHNPKAGAGLHPAGKLVATLEQSGLAVAYCATTDPDLPYMLRQPCDLVVAAGGDGTATRVLTELDHRATPVALLPLGTANNVARSLGVFAAPDLIAPAWRAGRIRRLDIGLAVDERSRRRFVEAVGLGSLNLAISEREASEKSKAERGKRRLSRIARLGFGRKAFFDAIRTATPARARIALDGAVSTGKFLLIEIMNLPFVGPGLNLAPAADPGDGWLDVVCIRPEQRQEMLAWLAATDGRGASPLAVKRAREVKIEWESDPIRLDDKLAAVPETLTVGLEGEPATILVPPGNGAAAGAAA